MKTKKTIKASLENKRLLFFEIGIIFSLSVALVAFEWAKESPKIAEISNSGDMAEGDPLPPVTTRDEYKKVPPVPLIQLHIVDNNKVIIDPVELPPADRNPDNTLFLPFESEPNVTDSIFQHVEIMPKYRGKHHNEFINFIYEHVHYPELAEQYDIEGTVYVKFVINEKGNLVNASIYKGVDPALDQEVLRVVSLSEKWTPGIQNFRPVKVSFIFPVKFKLIKT